MKLVNSYVGAAERASHAFSGKNPTNFENTLSHVVGYATAPLLLASEAYFGDTGKLRHNRRTDSAGPIVRVRKPGNWAPKIRKMPGAKKQFKKFVKKEVKKDVRKMRRKPRMPKRGTRLNAGSVYRPAGRGRGGRGRMTYRVGRSQTRLQAPPVAYGFVKSQTNGFTFGMGRRPGCLKMRGRQYLGSIQAFTDGSSNTWPVLRVQDKANSATAVPVTQFFVMPQNSYYFANPVFNMTQMFERYDMRTRMEFITTLGTSTPGSIKLAYYDDPAAFYGQTGKLGVASTGAALYNPIIGDAPTAANMSSMQTLVEGSVWKSFHARWSYVLPRQEMNYVPATSYTAFINPAAVEAIDMRQMMGGVWVIGGTGLVAGGASSYATLGEIWISYELELCDIMSNSPLQTVGLHAEKKPTDSKARETEKKLDTFIDMFERLFPEQAALDKQFLAQDKEFKSNPTHITDTKPREFYEPTVLLDHMRTRSKDTPRKKREKKQEQEDNSE